jgi:hypothetical protein
VLNSVWLRSRLPYIILVIAIAVCIGLLHNTDVQNAKIIRENKAAVARLQRDEEQLRALDSHVTYGTCLKFNKLNDKLATFLRGAEKRALMNYRAALASPFTTAAQKSAAQENFQDVNTFNKKLAKVLKDDHCVPLIQLQP